MKATYGLGEFSSDTRG